MSTQPADAGGRSRMALQWVWVVLATHGSLYPWQFAWPPSSTAATQWLLHPTAWWTGAGDVVGNIVLFVPGGALMAWPRHAERAGIARRLLALAAGSAFAFVLQMAQVFVPARDAALSDVVWNAVGFVVGYESMYWLARWTPTRSITADPRAHWILPLLWLALELWPFVPTIDLQHVKDALKPLLLHPRWSTLSAADAALSLAIVAHMLAAVPRRAMALLALLAVAAVGKLLIAGQSLSLAHLVGWIVGLSLAAALWRMRLRAATWTAAALASGWLTLDELRPFEFASEPSAFHFVPFAALLQGSMLTNLLALCWQAFWIGAVMLTVQCGLPDRRTTVAAALSVWLLALESIQTQLPGRVADITPALLPWLWWFAWPSSTRNESHGATTTVAQDLRMPVR